MLFDQKNKSLLSLRHTGINPPADETWRRLLKDGNEATITWEVFDSPEV